MKFKFKTFTKLQLGWHPKNKKEYTVQLAKKKKVLDAIL